ncbi:PCRF domain-containing protein, partial [Candidatus Saccharibacteria bacterium]|nr:PCRF domain-containing protein [Candidatus Saccharibacteria bacterium]
MDDKETKLRAELSELDKKLQDPAVFSDASYPKLARRKSQLDELIALFDERQHLNDARAQAKEMSTAGDAELAELARAELDEIEPRIEANQATLTEALTPQDPNNDRDVIIEIRAAAGGDESSLFAGELYRMYIRWAETHGYKS